MEDWSDLQLLKAYEEGTQNAFSILMNRHSSSVKAYALRMLRNVEHAEEICAETFLRIAMKKAFWKDRGHSFRSYLFRITHNLAIDLMRRYQTAKRSAEGVLELTLEQQIRPDPEAQAILGERATALERAIARLKEEEREVILLRCIHGLSSKETAKILDMNYSQIDAKLSYARKKLKGHLEDLQKAHQNRSGGRR